MLPPMLTSGKHRWNETIRILKVLILIVLIVTNGVQTVQAPTMPK